MRTISILSVGSEEQTLMLSDNYYADIKFDLIYKRWYYNLYRNGNIIAAGISLVPNSAGLLGEFPVSLGLLDTGNPHEAYETYEELGRRLVLVEITE